MFCFQQDMKRKHLASIIDAPQHESAPIDKLHTPIRKLSFEESSVQIKNEPIEQDDKRDPGDKSAEENPRPNKRSKRVSSDDVVYISESESDNDSDYNGRISHVIFN